MYANSTYMSTFGLLSFRHSVGAPSGLIISILL